MGIQGSLSFPANPTIGQTYTNAGMTWKFEGRGWKRVRTEMELVPPPGLEFLFGGGFNGVATLDFVFPSAILSRYRGIMWKMFVNFSVDGNGLRVNVSTDGGATFDVGATDYEYGGEGGGDLPGITVINSGAGQAYLAVNGNSVIGNAATEGLFAMLELMVPTIATRRPTFYYASTAIDNTATPGSREIKGGGNRNVAQDCDAVRFTPGAGGGLLGGKYALYGWR